VVVTTLKTNTEVNVKETDFGSMDWIKLPHGRVQRTAITLAVLNTLGLMIKMQPINS